MEVERGRSLAAEELLEEFDVSLSHLEADPPYARSHEKGSRQQTIQREGKGINVHQTCWLHIPEDRECNIQENNGSDGGSRLYFSYTELGVVLRFQTAFRHLCTFLIQFDLASILWEILVPSPQSRNLVRVVQTIDNTDEVRQRGEYMAVIAKATARPGSDHDLAISCDSERVELDLSLQTPVVKLIKISIVLLAR